MATPKKPSVVQCVGIDYSTEPGVGSGGAKTSATITWQPGDIIVVMVANEVCNVTYVVPTATGLTFTRAVGHDVDGTAAHCAAVIYSARASAAGSSGVTVDHNLEQNNRMGATIWVIRGANGIGTTAEQHTTTKTVSLTPTRINSLIVWGAFDWAAEATQTLTPTADTTRTTQQVSTHYTIHTGELLQTGSGAVSYGITGSPTTGPYTLVVAEVLSTQITSVFCCGCECGVTAASAHFISSSGSPSFSTTTKRSGARAFRANASGTAVSSTVTFSASNELRHVGRFYLYFASLPNGDTSVHAAGDSAGGPNIRFKSSDSKIYAAVSTTLGSTGVSVTTGVWYRMDFHYLISTGGNDTSDVLVDGTACGQATAAGFGSGSGNELFGVLNNVTADVFYDDIIISITAGDYPIGPGYVACYVPIADGTHNIAGTGDFQRGTTGTDILNATTTAYQLADDAPLPSGAVDAADNIAAIAPPNATDYVECVFGPATDINVPGVGPRGVDVILAHHQQATTSGNIRVALNDNGTTNDVLNLTAAGVTTYRYARKHYADPPSTATFWDVQSGNGNFNNARFRFYSSDAAPDQYLDGIMIEAEFEQSSLHVPVRRPQFIPRRKVV